MKYEPVFFLQEILSEDRPLTDLIDADYTYINRRLSRHYKVKGEFREQPKRVEIAENPHRGGLLSMAAILAVSLPPASNQPCSPREMDSGKPCWENPYLLPTFRCPGT